MARWRAWAGGIVLVVSGCSPFDLPPVVAETEHFRYRTRGTDPVCPTALEWLELQYAVLSDWFEASLPPGRKLDYTHVRAFVEMDDYCGPRAGGCAGDGMAFAFDPYNAHEVTHLVADLVGDPPALFREGIAEVLGCNPMVSPVEVHASMDLMELTVDGEFRTAEDLHQAYRWAAGFTRFLLDRHGREAFLGFYAQVPRRASSHRIAGDFASHFGEELRSAMEAWVAAPPQTYRDVCLHLAECAAPPLPQGDPEAVSFACGIGHGMAPRAVVRTLDVPEAMGARIRVEGDAPTRVEVFPCDTTMRSVEHAQRPDAPMELWTTLSAGRHWVRIADTAPGPETTETIALDLAATLAPSLLTPGFHDAASQALAMDGRRVVVRDWLQSETDADGTHRLVLRFDVNEPGHLSARTFSVPDEDEDESGTTWFDGRTVHFCGDTFDDTCEWAFLRSGSHRFDRPVSADDDHRFVIDGTPTEHGVMVELRLEQD